MSVFKGRKFEIIVLTACFDTFQLKTLIKADNIHDFTKILGISLFKTEVCPNKFQIGDIFSHFSHNCSYHTQLVIILALAALISHQC